MPEQVADKIESIWREVGCAGFNLTPTTNPDSVHDFVDQVVWLLQVRGVFRYEYTETTLRKHMSVGGVTPSR